jgi:hypothetical protein
MQVREGADATFINDPPASEAVQAKMGGKMVRLPRRGKMGKTLTAGGDRLESAVTPAG